MSFSSVNLSIHILQFLLKCILNISQYFGLGKKTKKFVEKYHWLHSPALANKNRKQESQPPHFHDSREEHNQSTLSGH
jgi:hypothetical protein